MTDHGEQGRQRQELILDLTRLRDTYGALDHAWERNVLGKTLNFIEHEWPESDQEAQRGLREALERIVDIGERPLSNVEDWPRRILSIARAALASTPGLSERAKPCPKCGWPVVTESGLCQSCEWLAAESVQEQPDQGEPRGEECTCEWVPQAPGMMPDPNCPVHGSQQSAAESS